MSNDEEPLPLAIRCDRCGFPHLDVGRWVTTPHRTHLCIACGNLIRVYDQPPFNKPSVGVLFADSYAIDDDEVETLSAARIRQMHETYDKLNEKRLALLNLPQHQHYVGKPPVVSQDYTADVDTLTNALYYVTEWLRARAAKMQADAENTPPVTGRLNRELWNAAAFVLRNAASDILTGKEP